MTATAWLVARGQRVPVSCTAVLAGMAGLGGLHPARGRRVLGGLPARPPPGRVVQDWVRGVRRAWGPSREGEPGRGGMEGWWPREGDTQQRGLERASATRGMVGSGRAAGGEPAGCHAGGWVPCSRAMLRVVARHPSGDAASPGAAGSQEILIYSRALRTWPHPAPTGLAGLRCWVLSPCTRECSQPGAPRGAQRWGAPAWQLPFSPQPSSLCR